MDLCKEKFKEPVKENKYNVYPFKCGSIYCVDFMKFTFYCTLCDNHSTSDTMNFNDYIRHFQNHLDLMNGKDRSVEVITETIESIVIEEENQTLNSFNESDEIILYDVSDSEINDEYLNMDSDLLEDVDPLQSSSESDTEYGEIFNESFITINEEDNQNGIENLLDFETTENNINSQSATQTNFTKGNVKEKSRSSKYICDACGKILQSQYKLKIHMRSHTGNNPYSCGQCGKSYRYTQNLNRHLLLHVNAKPYECHFCNKSYSSKDALQNHETIHTGVKNKYKCKLCEKSFGVPAYLEIHMRKHTGEKPYKCDICHATFVNKSNLINHHQPCPKLKFKCNVCKQRFLTEKEALICTHITLNNKNPVKQSWNCDKCTNSFKSRQLLNVHLKIHNHPYQCKDCNKGFPNEKSLTKHIEYYHNRERPYVCNICQSTFLTHIGLRKHKVRHSNTKPYKCLKCEKSFINSEGLNCHRKVHTDRVQCKSCGKFLTQLSFRTHKCQKLINN